MKYKVMVEYEYPVEHKTPVKAKLTLHGDSVETWNVKPLEQEPILDKLRAEITTLQHRCYALTKGTMCSFCKYECEYKAETEQK